MDEHEFAMEVLARVDFDLAYSSEKVANLEKLLIHLLSFENDLEETSLENEKDSFDLFEKSFVFDFLFKFLDSEVRELDLFMGFLQEVITDARSKITVFRGLTDLFEVMEAKLHDSEDLLKQSREQSLEIGLQLTKFTKAFSSFNRNDCSHDEGTTLSENSINTEEKPKMHSVEQRKHILRMLEKSLARELDLEKKLSELKQNEEDLKLKQRLTEQVAFGMQEAAEAVWGRFLEAENAKEVVLNTTKEILNRLQIVEFDLNGSMRREDEAQWKLVSSTEQLKAREFALHKLENSISELISDNLEVCSLREKVKLIEQQMKESDSQLLSASTLNEENEENILAMENIIESLKEDVYLAQNRADSAEAKVTELTETNSELNEELGFLKSTNDGNTKKVSTCEKQLRDLEIQLQHARASSEASQEQQNMLYSAIWDMETLIEELKSKVSKAEMKKENAELNNIELDKEVKVLRSKVESLEMCLDQAYSKKVASATDVDVKTEIIRDMVLQLALERERIQKQMFGLVVTNKVLLEKLQKSEKFASASDKNGSIDIGPFLFPKYAAREVTSESSKQVDESTKDKDVSKTEAGSSNSPDDNSNIVSEHDPETATNTEGTNGHNPKYVYLPIIILLFSVLSMYFFNKKANF